jgi:hypothetical protein
MTAWIRVAVGRGRRGFLGLLLTGPAAVGRSLGLLAQDAWLTTRQEATLAAVAAAVLPESLPATDIDAVTAAFLRWMRSYRADAEMDHGYGFPRLRRTPPNPARGYAAQLDDLETRARSAGASFGTLSIEQRRRLLAGAIEGASVAQLPGRPTGRHVATDLMGYYFNSSAANDLCYQARIGRDECRGLPGSENPPERQPASR